MFFTLWVMFWNAGAIMYFLRHNNVFFLVYKILRTIAKLFFSKFSQSSSFDGYFILSQLYLSIKGLIFIFLYEFFPMSSWFNTSVAAYWKHLLSFLLMVFILAFCFLSNKENLYLIQHNSSLFHDIVIII